MDYTGICGIFSRLRQGGKSIRRNFYEPSCVRGGLSDLLECNGVVCGKIPYELLQRQVQELKRENADLKKTVEKLQKALKKQDLSFMKKL